MSNSVIGGLIVGGMIGFVFAFALNMSVIKNVHSELTHQNKLILKLCGPNPGHDGD